MRRILMLAACLSALLSPAALAAQGGWYLAAQGGASIPQSAENDSDRGTFNTDFKPGYAFSVALGYDLGEAYPDFGRGRVELEVGYRKNDVDEMEFEEGTIATEGDVTVLSAMLNTFGEIRETAPFYPYLGAGVGVARLSLNDVSIKGKVFADDEDTVLAWQVGTGVGWRVSPYLVLDLGYRYFSAVDPSFTDSLGIEFDSEYDTHTVLLGARLDF